MSIQNTQLNGDRRSEEGKEPPKRITFTVPGDLHTSVHVYARQGGMTVTELLTQYLKELIAKENQPPVGTKMSLLISRSGKSPLDLARQSLVREGDWIDWREGRRSPTLKPQSLKGVLSALGCTQDEFVEACKEIDDALVAERLSDAYRNR